MVSSKIKNIHSELSKKYNIPVTKVAVICNNVFEYVRFCIKDSDDECDIRIPNFGKFRLNYRYRGKKHDKFVKKKLVRKK